MYALSLLHYLRASLKATLPDSLTCCWVELDAALDAAFAAMADLSGALRLERSFPGLAEVRGAVGAVITQHQATYLQIQ